jgi:hypothetical protein
MKMSEVTGKMRVRLSAAAASRHETAIKNGWRSPTGSLTSGRILASKPPFEEGLFVRVQWDGMPTPESWHLLDLEPVSPSTDGAA